MPSQMNTSHKAALTYFTNANFRILSEADKRLFVQSPLNNEHEIFIQPVNLDKDREIKINKQELGDLNDNLWVCLVLTMDNMEPNCI